MKHFFCLLALIAFSVSSLFAQRFGGDVAVSDGQIIAGDGQSQWLPGIVYLFEQQDDGAWAEAARLSASDSGSQADGFGKSVFVRNRQLIVGAPRARRAYIFVKSPDGPWSESSFIEGESEGFGSVAVISEDMAVVSDPGDDERAGSVLVFTMDESGQWSSLGEISAGDSSPGDLFGSSLAIVGDNIIIGAPGTSDGAGAVYLFNLDDSGSFRSAGSFTTRFSQEGNSTGSALATRGNLIAVGVPGFGSGTGTVLLYSVESDEPAFATRLSPFSSNRNDAFGSSIGFGNGQIWVGSPGYGGRRGTGAVYTFDFGPNGKDIVGTQMLDASGLKPGSSLGGSMAISERVAAIGAMGFDNRAGAVIPFSRDDEKWSRGSPLFDDTEGYDSMSGELVECKDEMAGDFPCKDVDMTSFVSMKDLGADRGIRTNDLWGWEDPATGREYAIVGLSNATSFVDVTDVYNPIPLGTLPMTATARMSVWRDMKVYKDHAFIVSDGAGEHGIQIFDLRQLRNVTGTVVFEETAHYSGIFSAHNIVINEETGFAYSVGSSSGGETCGGGLHMIDIREPTNPVFAGCFTDGSTGRRGTGYTHDAQCVVYHGPDTEHNGREICVGSNESAISIADVTDKDNPVSLAIAEYPNVAYAHQGWFSEDHRYFYLNDELDEVRDLVDGTRTLIWDLSDLDDPELAGEFIAETTETDHNMYIRGDLLYQSNTAAGLRILDISDPEHPFETAYFDTSPVGGRGVSWSNYPYFKSGSIIVTGGHYGLFILKKQEVDI